MSSVISLSLEDAAGLPELQYPVKTISSASASSGHSDSTLRSVSSSSPSQILESSIIRASEFTTSQTLLSTQVKNKINVMIKRKQYDELLHILYAWTRPTLSIQWNTVLSHDEFSYILGLLVTQQAILLTQAGSLKMLDWNSDSFKLSFKRAHATKNSIRAVYTNILNPDAHLYSKMGKSSDFLLSGKDYENIILLELNNAKLDLASQWFRHMELRYPNGEHYKLMTRNLWILKFKVYSGAHSPLWVIQRPELYENEILPRQSHFKSEILWMQMFDEYSKNQYLLLGSRKCAFDNQLVCAMLNSVAYSKNMTQVYSIIELNWGILPKGKMASKFVKPSKDDPLYPDIEVLTTIVLALIFNEDFRTALAYVNGFQENYSIDLQESTLFWDQVFRWSDLKTRFNELRALQVYLKKSECSVVLAPTNTSQFQSALIQAQKSPEFNYEGYLKFISRLQSKRMGLLMELWRCYQECSPGFSIRPYQTYFSLIEESPDSSSCYALLTALSREWYVYNVSEHSFNRNSSRATTSKIQTLYEKVLLKLLDIKGEAGDFDEFAPIIEQWSLDETMIQKILDQVEKRKSTYLATIKRREQRVKREEEQSKLLDDQEKLLDLFTE